jgi:hypothetical protein
MISQRHERGDSSFGSTGSTGDGRDLHSGVRTCTNVKKISPIEERYTDLRKQIPVEYHDYLGCL